MTMSRRDTIVIAVLVNAALLCLLFLMATQEDPIQVPKEESFTTLSMKEEPPMRTPIVPVQPVTSVLPVDEVDNALASYITANKETELIVPATVVSAAPSEGERSLVEITVKRGDALEKIARANGTSVTELRRLNGLANDKLSIGQILKVPVMNAPMATPPTTEVADEGEFYTLQAGDSPWLIAKKFHVRLEELLQWNSLDEAKARNLRPGDKVRVR